MFMATERQIAANRRNGLLSRGPLSDEGKKRSSGNAVTHGLTARISLLSGEDAEEFVSPHDNLTAEFRPAGALEHELVERIVSILWRLRRVPIFEAALMAWVEAREDEKGSFLFVRPSPPIANQASLRFGLTAMAFMETGLSDKLARYETSLQRQFSSLLKELLAAQERQIPHGSRRPLASSLRGSSAASTPS